MLYLYRYKVFKICVLTSRSGSGHRHLEKSCYKHVFENASMSVGHFVLRKQKL